MHNLENRQNTSRSSEVAISFDPNNLYEEALVTIAEAVEDMSEGRLRVCDLLCLMDNKTISIGTGIGIGGVFTSAAREFYEHPDSLDLGETATTIIDAYDDYVGYCAGIKNNGKQINNFQQRKPWKSKTEQVQAKNPNASTRGLGRYSNPE